MLRRVVTKAGQEIVIHEAPTPDASDSEASLHRAPLPHRPGSPNPKPANKRHANGVDFRMTSTESSVTSGSRGNTPPPLVVTNAGNNANNSIERVASSMADGIISGVFQAISPQDEKKNAAFTFSVHDNEPASMPRATKTPLPPPTTRSHRALCATKSTPIDALTSFSKMRQLSEETSDSSSSFASTSSTTSRKGMLIPPMSEHKFKCSPFSDYSEIPTGPRPKRGSMPEVMHRKLPSTSGYNRKPTRRMSDNFLAIPDEVQFSASPFVKAEFLQDQSLHDVILPSVTVQDIDAMNVPDDVMTIHEHTIESGKIPLTDFRGSVVREVSREAARTEVSREMIGAEISREMAGTETDAQTKKKPNVTVHTQLKHKTKAIKLDSIKPSIRESIKKTLSDPASSSKARREATMEKNRYVAFCCFISGPRILIGVLPLVLGHYIGHFPFKASLLTVFGRHRHITTQKATSKQRFCSCLGGAPCCIVTNTVTVTHSRFPAGLGH